MTSAGMPGDGTDADRTPAGKGSWPLLRPPFVVPRLVGVFTILVLVQLVVAQGISIFPRVSGIDFYGYWRVAAARRATDEALGAPYRNRRRYRDTLAQAAEGSDDARLREITRAGRRQQFTGSPLLYVVFAALPSSYRAALLVFQILQVLAFVAAIVILGIVYRYPPFSTLCLGLLLFLGSGSVFADLRVGNLGCLQLFSVVALLAVADRLRREPRLLLGGVLLTGLTLLTLVKPNVTLIAVMLGLHVWVAYGTRFFALSALPAAVAGAAAVAVTSLVFGSWAAWYQWYFGVFGHRPARLARGTGAGNYSTAKLFSLWLGVNLWTIAAVVAALLALSAIAVLVWSMRTDARMLAAPVRGILRRIVGDPHLAMAIGVVVSLALPHLVWYHYFVLAIIPSLWLLSGEAGPRNAPLWGFAALFFGSGVLNVLLLPLGWTNVAIGAAALSWIPLWGGILLRLGPAGLPESAAPAPAPATDQPRPRNVTNPPRSRKAARRQA